MQLKKLREKLPNNYATIAAKNTGMSLSYVRAVLAGKRNNELILKELIKIAKEHQEKIKNYEESIAAL